MIIEPSDHETLASLWSRVPYDQRRQIIREWIWSDRPAASTEDLAELLIEIKQVENEPPRNEEL